MISFFLSLFGNIKIYFDALFIYRHGRWIPNIFSIDRFLPFIVVLSSLSVVESKLGTLLKASLFISLEKSKNCGEGRMTCQTTLLLKTQIYSFPQPSTIIVHQYPYCDLCTTGTVVLTTVTAERFHPSIHLSIPSILYHGTILIFHTGSRSTCITITTTSIPWW